MANEKRLIDANALITAIQGTASDVASNAPYEPEWFTRLAQRQVEILGIVDDATTVDAVEVAHGKWLYDSGSERHFCSACNEYALSATTNEQVADYDWEENLVYRIEVITKEFWTDYCPNCGAKMDGDGNG